MADMLFEELIERYPCLSVCQNEIKKASELLYNSAAGGGKILVCGNGGSSADSDHIVGELMKGFLKKRQMPLCDAEKFEATLGEGAKFFTEKLQGAIPAVSLSAQTGISSAFINDVEPSLVYAQMVYGLGREGDLLIAISTSGNSENVVNALLCAKAMGLRTIALTGERESKLSENADVAVKVPERETFKVQELHLPVYHYLCASVEEKIFEK